jgi:hypothetical protein
VKAAGDLSGCWSLEEVRGGVRFEREKSQWGCAQSVDRG